MQPPTVGAVAAYLIVVDQGNATATGGEVVPDVHQLAVALTGTDGLHREKRADIPTRLRTTGRPMKRDSALRFELCQEL
jgi:hypothetical protein